MTERKEEEKETIEKAWEKLKKMVREALMKEEWKAKRKEIGHMECWDRSCTRMKRKVHREYKKWKKGKSAEKNI